MNRFLLCLTYSLLAFSSLMGRAVVHAAEIPTDISQKSKPATLKIRILDQVESAILEVKGRYEIFDPLSHFPLTSGFFGKRKSISVKEDGIHWGEKIPGIHHIRIVPSLSESTILVDGIEYRGCMEVYSQGERLTMINEIDIESYLKSILSAQIFPYSEEHLLEAIAIIARTNAYYLAMRANLAKWHAAAEEVQYYGNAMSLQNLLIDRSIENTRHMVMTLEGRPFACCWTENSAGRTASYANIFRKQVITPQGVTASLAAKTRSQHTWSAAISAQEMAEAYGLSKITAIHSYLDPDSEKVYALQLTDGILTKNIDFFTLQQKIGKGQLRSNDFTVSLHDDKVIFKGWGQGHGVGLCLYSAHLLAERAASSVDILSPFFPRMELKQLRTLPEQ